MSLKKYAITGGIASGKSTFCHIIKAMSLPFVDCDALVHESYQPGGLVFEAVVKHFGTEILNDFGQVDRKRLGQIIFTNPELKLELEKLTHPIVIDLVNEQVKAFEESGASCVFVDVPLLFENALESDYDASILIDTEETLQLERLMKRNKFSESEALHRIKAQLPLAEKRKRATFIINNNSTPEDFHLRAEMLITTLIKNC